MSFMGRHRWIIAIASLLLPFAIMTAFSAAYYAYDAPWNHAPKWIPASALPISVLSGLVPVILFPVKWKIWRLILALVLLPSLVFFLYWYGVLYACASGDCI